MEGAKVMKYRTTKNAVKNNFGKVWAVGYCGFSSLLQFESPRAYTCGVYGWNADIYEFGGVAIVTGYRPFGKDIPQDLRKRYEEEAQKVARNYGISYEERKRRVSEMLRDMLGELAQL